MEGASTKGVLSHLSLLEVVARSRKTEPQQQSRVEELRAQVEALRVQKRQLEAEMKTHRTVGEKPLTQFKTSDLDSQPPSLNEDLWKLRSFMDKHCADDEEEEMDEDSENSQLLQLMARHTQLNDLLHAHHIIGGYDITKTRQGKAVCVSLATAYEGIYLDTYNLEIDLKPKVRISRHNIPPFIPLNTLAEENMQTDLRAFLDLLSQHLNAFAGRKQQLKLLREQHKSVEVLESNVLCSILVLMLTVSKEKTPVLCSLDYTDHTRCLPTQVNFKCEDQELLDSPQWKKSCTLLMETPVHKALTAMKI